MTALILRKLLDILLAVNHASPVNDDRAQVFQFVPAIKGET
jgi:hypothetical protein